MEVVAVPLDPVQRTNADGHVDVPGWATERPRVPGAAHTDPLPVVDPRGDVELERRVLERPPVSLAALARRLHDAACPVAARAGSRADDLPEHGAGHLLDDARAATPGARDGRRPRSRPRAAAGLAAARDHDLHVELRTGDRLGEVDLHLRRDVRPTRRPRPRTRRPTEERLAEERGEDVREAAEVGVHGRETAAAEARVPEAVVRPPTLRVGEHLVRLGDGPEPQLRVRLLAHVRVELARQIPERALDLGVARVPRDAEQLVVVLLRRRHQGAP